MRNFPMLALALTAMLALSFLPGTTEAQTGAGCVNCGPSQGYYSATPVYQTRFTTAPSGGSTGTVQASGGSTGSFSGGSTGSVQVASGGSTGSSLSASSSAGYYSTKVRRTPVRGFFSRLAFWR